MIMVNMFQVYPPPPGGILMHEYMLGGWGMPIGKSNLYTFKVKYLIITTKVNSLTSRDYQRLVKS